MENKEIKEMVNVFLDNFNNEMDILKTIYYSLEILLYSLDFNIVTNEEKEQYYKIANIKTQISKLIKNNKEMI